MNCPFCDESHTVPGPPTNCSTMVLRTRLCPVCGSTWLSEEHTAKAIRASVLAGIEAEAKMHSNRIQAVLNGGGR